MVRGEVTRVRLAAPEDARVLHEIAAAAFHDPWPVSDFAAAAADSGLLLLVAVRDGDPAGYIYMRLLDPEAEIYSLAVRPETRRKGVGRALVSRALEICRDRGMERIFLEVRDSNVPAVVLYEALGFVPVGRRRGYYSNPTEDAILMAADV